MQAYVKDVWYQYGGPFYELIFEDFDGIVSNIVMIVATWVFYLTVREIITRCTSRKIMGTCLCKQTTTRQQVSSGENNSQERSNHERTGNVLAFDRGSDINQRGEVGHYISRLIIDVLKAIRTLVENESAPPQSLVRLHHLAEKEGGWVAVVHAMIYTIRIQDTLGPAVITLLMDECPLPTKEAIVHLTQFLHLSKYTAERAKPKSTGDPDYHRNTCIVLGCISEKMAGPGSVSLLTKDVLEYLFTNLQTDSNPHIILHSIVALEKFAETSENKATISKKLTSLSPNPLVELESWYDSHDYVKREVGFCAQWCLDNLFVEEGRTYVYETLDHTGKNVILNCGDSSEYLKIAANGLEARCDASSFESVRSTLQVESGVWYYEVVIITPGVMQIGFATKHSKFLNYEGYGIGDDEYSLAYDGCRQLVWYNAKSEGHRHPCWKPGDVLGLLLNLDEQEIVFSLNGDSLPPCKQVFSHARSGYFAAASFMSFQQCEFNFGMKPFKFPPSISFKKFNDHATLTYEEKIILPRHKKLALLRQLTIKEDSCTLCFDNKAEVSLQPCGHQGFCMTCSIQLDICPLCRETVTDRTNDEGNSDVIHVTENRGNSSICDKRDLHVTGSSDQLENTGNMSGDMERTNGCMEEIVSENGTRNQSPKCKNIDRNLNETVVSDTDSGIEKTVDDHIVSNGTLDSSVNR